MLDVLERIATLCGDPGWTHTDTVIADVESVIGERDRFHAKFLAYLLVDAAPELCEVPDLITRLQGMKRDQRLVAEGWASGKLAVHGDIGRMPTMPPCILTLYRALPFSTPESDA